MDITLKPDVDNRYEMWLAFTLIGNFARAGNEWVFVGALLILILYIIGWVLLKTSLYLFETYNERLRETGTHVRPFRYAVYGVAIACVVSVPLIFSGNPDMLLSGLSVLATAFGVMSVFTVAYDWWLAYNTQHDTQPSGVLTVTDMLRMKQTITTARQQTEQTKV